MQEAITLNPSLSSAYAHLGSCYSLSGCPEDGLAMVRTALRLNPLDTQNFHQFGELALATLMLGHHDRSVIEADNALARRPGYVYGHRSEERRGGKGGGRPGKSRGEADP